MNRREFFKWLSKGVSLATLDPKAVTKIVMNAQAAPAASTAAPDILGALKNMYSLERKLNSSVSLEAAPGLVKQLSGSVLSIIGSLDKAKILNRPGKKADNFSEAYISRAVKELKEFETDIISSKTIEAAREVIENNLSGGNKIIGEVIYEMSLLPDMYTSNLITKDAERYLMDVLPNYDYETRTWFVNRHVERTIIGSREYAKTGKWPSNEEVEKLLRKEYPERREEEIEQERKDKEQEQYDQTSKDIDYSRIDKAGGAEDTDYAKYYEKVNTFDGLLSILTEEDDPFDYLFQNLDTVFYCVIVNWSNIESSEVRVFKNADEFINYYNRCMDGLIASNYSEFFNPANCKKITILDNYYNELIEDIKRFGYITVGAYPNKSIYFALSKDDVITAAAGDIAEDGAIFSEDGDQLYEKIVAILQTKFNKLKG